MSLLLVGFLMLYADSVLGLDCNQCAISLNPSPSYESAKNKCDASTSSRACNPSQNVCATFWSKGVRGFAYQRTCYTQASCDNAAPCTNSVEGLCKYECCNSTLCNTELPLVCYQCNATNGRECASSQTLQHCARATTKCLSVARTTINGKLYRKGCLEPGMDADWTCLNNTENCLYQTCSGSLCNQEGVNDTQLVAVPVCYQCNATNGRECASSQTLQQCARATATCLSVARTTLNGKLYRKGCLEPGKDSDWTCRDDPVNCLYQTCSGSLCNQEGVNDTQLVAAPACYTCSSSTRNDCESTQTTQLCVNAVEAKCLSMFVNASAISSRYTKRCLAANEVCDEKLCGTDTLNCEFQCCDGISCNRNGVTDVITEKHGCYACESSTKAGCEKDQLVTRCPSNQTSPGCVSLWRKHSSGNRYLKRCLQAEERCTNPSRSPCAPRSSEDCMADCCIGKRCNLVGVDPSAISKLNANVWLLTTSLFILVALVL